MTVYEINPYIRRAIHSVLKHPFSIKERVLLDYELLYVQEGACKVGADDNNRKYQTGDFILIPPGVKHAFKSVGIDFNQPHIHFDLQYDYFSAQRFISFKNESDLSAKEKEMMGQNIFRASDIQIVQNNDKQQLVDKFYQIIDLYAHEPQAELRCKGILCEILSELLSGKLEKCQPAESEIQQVKRYLDLNFTNVIRLEHLSAYFYMNKYTLLRQFQKAYGIGIMEYVNKRKVEYAKQLLQEKKSITEIGDALGFSSIYTFSRFFKNQTGCAPKYYAQEAKDQ